MRIDLTEYWIDRGHDDSKTEFRSSAECTDVHPCCGQISETVSLYWIHGWFSLAVNLLRRIHTNYLPFLLFNKARNHVNGSHVIVGTISCQVEWRIATKDWNNANEHCVRIDLTVLLNRSQTWRQQDWIPVICGMHWRSPMQRNELSLSTIPDRTNGDLYQVSYSIDSDHSSQIIWLR